MQPLSLEAHLGNPFTSAGADGTRPSLGGGRKLEEQTTPNHGLNNDFRVIPTVAGQAGNIWQPHAEEVGVCVSRFRVHRMSF